MARATRKARAGAAARRRETAPRSGDDVRALARDAAVAALTRLAELANSEDERVALAASQELLNRAFGKSPAAATDDQGGAAQPLVIRIIRFGAEAPDGTPAKTPAKPGRDA